MKSQRIKNITAAEAENCNNVELLNFLLARHIKEIDVLEQAEPLNAQENINWRRTMVEVITTRLFELEVLEK